MKSHPCFCSYLPFSCSHLSSKRSNSPLPSDALLGKRFPKTGMGLVRQLCSSWETHWHCCSIYHLKICSQFINRINYSNIHYFILKLFFTPPYRTSHMHDPTQDLQWSIFKYKFLNLQLLLYFAEDLFLKQLLGRKNPTCKIAHTKQEKHRFRVTATGKINKTESIQL